MNDKVAKLIYEAKAEMEASNKRMQEEHLISLGLLDESKTERSYQEYFSETAKFDEEKNMYYIETPVAMSVTADEYAEICKYFPPIKEEKKLEKTIVEKALNAIATATLITGVFCTIICLFTIVFVDSGKYSYSNDLTFNATGFIITLGVLFSSLITWALLRVISDISVNIREINNK